MLQGHTLKLFMRKYLLFLSAVLCINFSIAQDTSSIRTAPARTDSTVTDNNLEHDHEPVKIKTDKEFNIGLSVLSVLIVVLLLLMYFIRKHSLRDDLSVKLILTTIVIISTLFLIAVGYKDSTVAPAFGLFGAILGYVFGRSESDKKQDT